MKKNLSIILIVLMLVIPVFAMGAKTNIGYFEQEIGKIEVNGYAKITKKADIVNFHIRIENIAKNNYEAQNNVNRTSNNLIKELIGLEIKEESIVTNNIRLSKYQEWIKDEYVDKGYRAVQSIDIKIDFDKDLVGKIVKIMSTDNNTRISYISYELKNREQYDSELRRKAVINAYEKATDYALASNSKIDRVLFITENIYNDYTPSYRGSYEAKSMAMDSGMDEPTNIYPSNITLTKQVKVIYTVK